GGDAQGDAADLAGLNRGCASPHPHANQPLYAEEDTKTSQRAQPETKARGEGARNRRQEEEPSGTRIVAWLERAKDYARLIGPATAEVVVPGSCLQKEVEIKAEDETRKGKVHESFRRQVD